MSGFRLKTRVLWLTALFALALVAITYGLSWQAHRAQQRWSEVVRVESGAVSRLDEFIRDQNNFRSRLTPGDPAAAARYRRVEQLLDRKPLGDIDTAALRTRVRAYRDLLQSGAPAEELDRESARVVLEASRLSRLHQQAIADQLPHLERQAGEMTRTGLAIAWIVILISFAVAQITLREVVNPIERLGAAARLIAGGDLGVKAPGAGVPEIAELADAFNHMAEKLKAAARTDTLTGLPNVRAFRERIDAEIASAMRYDRPFGVLVLDLDRFKSYNDTYGHLAGDDALRRVADAVQATLRGSDFPARYGGEEFVVITKEVDAEALAAVGERIRAAVEAIPPPQHGAKLTVSIGGAMFPADGTSRETLFHIADGRLYRAKEEGRNRVVAVTAPARAVQSAGSLLG